MVSKSMIMAQKYPDIVDTEVESWEISEVEKTDKIFKTSVHTCVVCGVGTVVKETLTPLSF